MRKTMNGRRLFAAALCATMGLAAQATATVLVEYDAATSNGLRPDEVSNAWSPAGIPMVHMGNYLLQDNTFDDPTTESGRYTSPSAGAGLMRHTSGQYGLEATLRPLTDMPYLGYSHYANAALLWSDDSYIYNVSFDKDSDDAGSGTTGALRYGQNSMYAAVSDIDWSIPHTIYVGYRGADPTGVFDFYVDGVLKSTISGASMRRTPGFPFARDAVAFGDHTTGQPAPHSLDLAVEWYSVRIYDVAAPVVAPSAWAVDDDGNWSVAANWSNGVPNSLSGTATATFGSAITAPRTVTLDVPQTIGYVNFDNAKSYTLDGPGTLTFSIPGTAQINVVQGNHTISAPVSMTSPVTATVAAGSTLALSGDSVTTGANATFAKTGAGTLVLSHIRGHRLTVDAGMAQVIAGATPNSAAGVSVLKELAITGGPAAPTAQLDLTNNSLVLDYSEGGSSPAQDVRQYLLNGGIVSSAANANTKLGYGESGEVLGAGGGTFAGQAVDDSAVLIKFTYAGDANLDGQVDVIDLGNLATAWQTNGAWANGDSNYDGFVDVIDLGQLATNWQAGVGNPLGPSLGEALASLGLPQVAVPEPAGAFGLALAFLAACRRRRHG